MRLTVHLHHRWRGEWTWAEAGSAHEGNGGKASKNVPNKSNSFPAEIAFAGLLLAGFLGRSSRRLAAAGLRDRTGVTGAGALGLRWHKRTDGARSGKGTYTITFTGTDSTNNAITAQSSFTLVIN